MLEKTYDAADVEPEIAKRWDEADAFAAGAGARAGADPFCIVIPPPNVTGSLHMGHALNNTLQDMLIRFERMRGRRVLWQPGMDHAGIATQMVVERQLAGQELDRREMGREAFIERVWEWKDESGGQIINQLKRLGASCDWSRERFTMDEGLSQAVVEVFVTLYKDGLIYKDKRLVNWDPKLLTAISDLEVEQREVDGSLWHFRYPLADGVTYEHPVAFDEDGNATEWETRDYLVVATTRPETMLGDTGVAVHPDDRALCLAGRQGRRPAARRAAHPDRRRRICRSGGGHRRGEDDAGARFQRFRRRQARPASGRQHHDPGRAHHAHRQRRFPRRACRRVPIWTRSCATSTAWTASTRARWSSRRWRRAVSSSGSSRTATRCPHGDRAGVPIEPFLTDQWYVNAAELARPAIEAVREGRTHFVPKNWEKTYFEWMENIQPWCVSRQLWWGHQIPAWYGPDGQVFVEKDEEAALDAAVEHYIAVEGPGRPGSRTSSKTTGRARSSSATRTCSTPGSPRRSGRSRRSAGRTRRRNWRPTTRPARW